MYTNVLLSRKTFRDIVSFCINYTDEIYASTIFIFLITRQAVMLKEVKLFKYIFVHFIRSLVILKMASVLRGVKFLNNIYNKSCVVIIN